MVYFAVAILRFFMAWGIVMLLEYLLPTLSAVSFATSALMAAGVALAGTLADAQRRVSPFIRGVTDFFIALVILSASRWLAGGASLTMWASFLAAFFIGLGGMFLPYHPHERR